MALKIAHVVGKLMAGGVESVVFSYLRNMDRTGLDIDVLYDADSTVSPPRDLVERGIRFIEIPPYQKVFDYMKTVKRLCVENGYDIVHSDINALSVFPLTAAKRAGVRHLICHNHSTSSKAEWKRNAAKKVLRPLARRSATDYAACSALAAEWMYGKDALSEGRVKIFNNAIDAARFSYSESDRDAIRDEFSLNGKFVVGHIGRFVTQKNHKYLIEVFSELAKIRPDAVLMLLGEGELLGSIKELAAQLDIEDRVVFVGIVPDPWRYYSAFDVFLLPSLYEGLPVVAMEAQASGLDCYISTEVTKECAITQRVRFIPLDDGAQKWAKVISEYEGHDRTSDSEAISEGKFNIVNSANDMRNYYFEIMRGEASSSQETV